MPVAAGTPARLLALLSAPTNPTSSSAAADDEAAPPLHLDQLRLILLDATWRDAKNRGLCEGPETREELVRLLTQDGVRGRLRRGETRIAVF